MGRVFSFGPDGDRMVSHVTDVVTSCSDGTLRAPYLIKVRGGAESAKNAAKKRKLGEEVCVADASVKDKAFAVDDGAEDNERLNIGVGVSPNGSMTLEVWVKWVDHFVDHCLLPGQGKGEPLASCQPGPSLTLRTTYTLPDPAHHLYSRCAGGEPVFLFLDGHASRWTLAGFAKLRKNNVYVICVPSHTTIWSQPNDNGINAAMKVCAILGWWTAGVVVRGGWETAAL